jgi:predicted transcriptional regulator of viral defense system
MQTITEYAIERARRVVFTRQEAAFWAGCDGAALDGLLKRAVRAGEVWRYRRGLYGLAPRFSRVKVDLFALAQYLHGPSYLSLEAALAHHGWIPEAVYTVTCATCERSRSFETPLGLFAYTRIPQNEFFAGVRQETAADGGVFFVASPLKALADYIYVHRPAWKGPESARASLRIDEADWAALDGEMVNELEGVYRDARVLRFLDAVGKELDR